MESTWHGTITSQCADKMLSNNAFLETRIQPLHDGIFIVKKVLGVHVQRMLKLVGVYTLAEVLSKLLGTTITELIDFYSQGISFYFVCHKFQ